MDKETAQKLQAALDRNPNLIKAIQNNREDDAEGEGFAFQDPWEFVMKNVLDRATYDAAYKFHMGREKLKTQEDCNLDAWGATVLAIATDSIPAKDMESRVCQYTS